MSETPQAAIRRYLDEQGGRVDGYVSQLMSSWTLTSWREPDRVRVAQDLLSVGVLTDPPLDQTAAATDPLVLYTRDLATASIPDGGPAETARNTVEQNGGTYRTDAGELLGLFGRQQLTEKARSEVDQALAAVGVGVRPDLSIVHRTDPLDLYLLEQAPPQPEWMTSPKRATAEGPVRQSSSLLRPRTWKGWAVYGVIGLLILGALLDEDTGRDGDSTGDPARQEVAPTEDRSDEGEQLRRERQRIEREREQLREERARVRGERLADERRRERARRAAERREEQEALQAAPPPAPVPEPVPEPAAGCDPNYDPCVPSFPPDLNCPDVGGPVSVTGSDPHGLDADGDGVGCDS